jgi:hypothetical protein
MMPDPWIQCIDKMPDPNTSILIAHDMQCAFEGPDSPLCVTHGLLGSDGKWYHIHHNWFDKSESPEIDGEILYWMPAPKPPIRVRETVSPNSISN